MFITIHIRVFNYDVAQIFKIWCMLELFILALKLPGKKERLMPKIGRKYSSYIYLFHYLIGLIIINIFYIDWLLQILVIIISILISMLLYKIILIITRRIKGL